MNTRQLEYAIKLSQVLNFSHAAEQLDMSQPALSKQILNLETELGVKLFNRNTSPLTLTPAGEYFIQHAKELVYKEDQLMRAIERFKTGEQGRLDIGISPFRGRYLIPGIVKQFKQKYPGVQVVLHEPGSDQLRKEAAEGKYDLAIVNLPVDESLLEITPLEPEQLVLAVPNEMLENISFAQDGPIPQIDFKDCSKLPFVVASAGQEMRMIFDKICTTADFYPNITAEVVGLSTALSLAQAGVGATLLPLQLARGAKLKKDATLFTLKDVDYLRYPVIVTRRGQYLSEYAQYAIKLLTDSANL